MPLPYFYTYKGYILFNAKLEQDKGLVDGVCGSGNKIGKGVKVCRCFILERFKITMALNSKASDVAIVKLFYVNTKSKFNIP